MPALNPVDDETTEPDDEYQSPALERLEARAAEWSPIGPLLPNPPAEALAARVQELEEQVARLDAALGGLADRLAELERRPALASSASPDSSADFDRRLLNARFEVAAEARRRRLDDHLQRLTDLLAEFRQS
jgi:hypothetical protein